MKNFALITHLLSKDSELNDTFYPPLKFIKRVGLANRIDKILPHLPPYKMSYVDQFCSVADKKTNGWIITLPLLPTHFATKNENFLIKKILSGCKLAKRLGADIVGLAAFTSVVGDEGAVVSKYTDIAITSGNTYSSCLAIDGLLKAAERLSINLEEAHLSIIGATGDIGSICTKVLAQYFKNITLVGRDKNKLETFAKTITSGKNILVDTNVKHCVQNSDLILCVASSVFPLFDVKDLKSGAVVCDVSVPPAVLKTKENFRSDVLIFDGGKAKVNLQKNCYNKEWKLLFPDNVIFGCLAETILLALDEKIENFSVGRGSITIDKIETISRIASRHGFEIALFKYGDYYYSEEDLNKIKKCKK